MSRKRGSSGNPFRLPPGRSEEGATPKLLEHLGDPSRFAIGQAGEGSLETAFGYPASSSFGGHGMTGPGTSRNFLIRKVFHEEPKTCLFWKKTGRGKVFGSGNPANEDFRKSNNKSGRNGTDGTPGIRRIGARPSFRRNRERTKFAETIGTLDFYRANRSK